MTEDARVWVLRAVVVSSVMAMSPYCYRPAFIDYQFVLTTAPGASFALTESATAGRYELRRSPARDTARCRSFRSYDVLLRRSGGNDIGQDRFFVGLDPAHPALLHVVMHFDTSHEEEPD